MNRKPQPAKPGTHACCGHTHQPNDWVGVCWKCGLQGCQHCLTVVGKLPPYNLEHRGFCQ